jgi:hypothetical protein
MKAKQEREGKERKPSFKEGRQFVLPVEGQGLFIFFFLFLKKGLKGKKYRLIYRYLSNFFMKIVFAEFGVKINMLMSND